MKTSTKVGAGATVGWLVVGLGYGLVKWWLVDTKWPDPNSVGDFLAGVFSPVAFLWLILGYHQQGEELKLNTKALRDQERAAAGAVQPSFVLEPRPPVQTPTRTMIEWIIHNAGSVCTNLSIRFDKATAGASTHFPVMAEQKIVNMSLPVIEQPLRLVIDIEYLDRMNIARRQTAICDICSVQGDFGNRLDLEIQQPVFDFDDWDVRKRSPVPADPTVQPPG